MSSDSQYVVYVAGSQSSYGSWEDAVLYSAPLGGGVAVQLGTLDWQPRDVQRDSLPYHQYVITPDSRQVVFQDGDTLYWVPISGGAAQQLARRLGAAGAAGPETGEAVRTALHNEVPDFRLYSACQCIIYRTLTALTVLPLDGSPTVTFAETPGGTSYIYGYTVSADGRSLLYDTRKYDRWDTPKTPSRGSGLIKIVAIYAYRFVAVQQIDW